MGKPQKAVEAAVEEEAFFYIRQRQFMHCTYVELKLGRERRRSVEAAGLDFL